MIDNKNKFVYLAVVLGMFFFYMGLISVFADNYSVDGKQKQALTKDSLEKMSSEITRATDKGFVAGVLSKLSESLEGATKAIEKTIVFTITNENGYINVEDIKVVATESDNDNSPPIMLKNLTERLESLYKEKRYDRVVLLIGADVNYIYIYKVISSFEKFLLDSNFPEGEIAKIEYVFQKPL